MSICLIADFYLKINDPDHLNEKSRGDALRAKIGVEDQLFFVF